MKQSIIRSLILVMAAVMLTGCGKERRNGSFLWPSVDETTDSLTQELDRACFHRLPDDSIAPLVKRLHQLAEGNPADIELQGRDLYYRIFLERYRGDFDRGDSLAVIARELVDSASHPYLYNRLMFLTDDIVDRSVENYRTKRARLNYFETVGDNFMAGAHYTDIGNLMKNINYPAEAIKAYAKADSLFMLAGFEDVAISNRINRATTMAVMRDTVGAVALLGSLRDDMVVKERPGVMWIVLANLYDLTRESSLVDEMAVVEGEDLRSRTLIFLSERETENGNYRQGADYAREAFFKAYHRNYGEDMALASIAAGKAYEGLGMIDSAYIWTSQGMIISDEVREYSEEENIVDAEVVDAVAAERLEAELAANRRTLHLVYLISALVVLLLIAGWMTAWRMQRLKERRRDLEQGRRDMTRKLMATQIAMDESQQLISSVKKEISEMADSGDITGSASRPIVNAIKSYEVQQGQRETFIRSFTEVHPEFARRMRERSEAFTEPDIRLASYIVMGMDTKHIASTMGIRPESVKQGRWRLRTKLGLPKGASLEETLRNLID